MVTKHLSERPHTAIFATNLFTTKRSVYMIKCEITVPLQESTEGRLTTAVIFNCVLGNVIPIVFHNLHGYNSHLIMQAISQVDGEITCIPNNVENYISFSLIKKKKLEKVQKKVRADHSGKNSGSSTVRNSCTLV